MINGNGDQQITCSKFAYISDISFTKSIFAWDWNCQETSCDLKLVTIVADIEGFV